MQPLAATCGTCRSGHLRPLAATRVAESGCKWLQIMQMAASDAALEISNPTNKATGHVQPRAATCGHLRPLALAATCGHLRPLAATCGHLRPLALAASCSHLRPLEWLQVAASGCFFDFKYRAFCDLNETLFPLTKEAAQELKMPHINLKKKISKSTSGSMENSPSEVWMAATRPLKKKKDNVADLKESRMTVEDRLTFMTS